MSSKLHKGVALPICPQDLHIPPSKSNRSACVNQQEWVPPPTTMNTFHCGILLLGGWLGACRKLHDDSLPIRCPPPLSRATFPSPPDPSHPCGRLSNHRSLNIIRERPASAFLWLPVLVKPSGVKRNWTGKEWAGLGGHAKSHPIHPVEAVVPHIRNFATVAYVCGRRLESRHFLCHRYEVTPKAKAKRILQRQSSCGSGIMRTKHHRLQGSHCVVAEFAIASVSEGLFVSEADAGNDVIWHPETVVRDLIRISRMVFKAQTRHG